MTADRLIPVFVDASVLIAAAGSPFGGSSVLLHLCAEFVSGHVSAPVLIEAERNILARLPPAGWERWQYLLLATPLLVVDVPTDAARFADSVTSKDAHVYAAALAAGIPTLVTLDQPLAKRVNALGGPVTARSPGAFIRQVLTR